MKIATKGPFEWVSGTWDETDLVYAHNSLTGTSYAYGKPKRTDPKSYDQVLTRSIGSQAVQHWSAITHDQRTAWERYAETVVSEGKRRRALDICREAARMRLTLGLDPRAEAPVYPAPAGVTSVTLGDYTAPDEFGFRIEHAVESPAACMVLVKITAATASAARKPIQNDARCICGFGAQSAFPLPNSGGVLNVTGARFSIEPGQRFGAALTVIRTEDGLASAAKFFDLFR